MVLNFLRKKMKIIALVVAVAFVAGGTLVYLNFSGNNKGQNQAYAQDERGAIAKVNGEKISYQEYSGILNALRQRYRGRISQGQVLALKSNALDQLIQRKLLLQEVENREIKVEVKDKEIQEQYNKVVNRYANSKEEFKKILEKNGLSVSEYKENIKQQLETQKKIQALLKQVNDDIKVTEDEIKYKNVTASHILIKTDNKSDQKAKQKAEDVLAKIKGGKSFAEMAKKYSEGPSATNGGQLGSFGHGKMVPSFEQKAFSMKVGEVSKPVKTQFGYHIIKVTDKKKVNSDKLAKDKNQIKQKLLDQKRNHKISKLISELRNEANIVINNPEISAYKATQKGNYQQAITDYQAAIDNNPKTLYLYSHLAQVYLRADKSDKAVKLYQEAINKFPKQPNLYGQLGSLYQKLDKTDKAVDVYKKGLKKNSESAELHLMLGNLYRKQSKKDKAIAQYDKVSELAGEDIRMRLTLAKHYESMGLDKKAKSEKNKAEELKKKNQELMKKRLEQIRQQKAKSEQQSKNNN